MVSETLLYLIPYVVSLILSTSVGVISWRRSDLVGARAYALIAFGQASWTFGYIFELASPTLEGKIFWDNFQFIGGPFWFIGFLVFVLHFTGRRFQRPSSLYHCWHYPV